MLAVRAFDADAMIIGFELVEGQRLEGAIERQFTDPRAAYPFGKQTDHHQGRWQGVGGRRFLRS